ncbi:MAG TPA: protein phosphatase 2C domain-containing protein, partial [Fimbriimonadaceae bacterium]|nr:protein phosphatase 2C domain-containing protein [Fimbriimonadaceae bacterium]
KGMGTTLSALMIVQDTAYIAQVGDSRIYRLRNGELAQMTTDHTWVEETVKAGMMSREEAEAHPYKHVLTRAIGTESDMNTDIFAEPAMVGDVYMICSDGLTNHVTNEEIEQVLSENGPSEAAWSLVTKALVGGGSDNTTVIVVRLDGLANVS